MIRSSRAICATAALIAGLGACHGREKATGHGTVSGEILPGSISDAMLPYDSVKSKAPLAPMAKAGRPANAPSNNAADNTDTDVPAPDSTAPVFAASPGTATPSVAN